MDLVISSEKIITPKIKSGGYILAFGGFSQTSTVYHKALEHSSLEDGPIIHK